MQLWATQGGVVAQFFEFFASERGCETDILQSWRTGNLPLADVAATRSKQTKKADQVEGYSINPNLQFSRLMM
jgi:hypothetical protein